MGKAPEVKCNHYTCTGNSLTPRITSTYRLTMRHQPATVKPTVEERLNMIRKEIRTQNASMVPDFSKRTADLDPKTRQLLRQLDNWGHEGPEEK